MKIIDMHCDTIYEICERQKRGEDICLRRNSLMVDLEKLRQGGYSVQNFALFVEQEKGVSSFDKVKELLTVFQREMMANEDWISMVTTTKDIVKNERAGKLSALLTVEGGEACEGNMENLHFLYEQGVRMMTLTWNYPNEIGYPNFKEGVDFFTANVKDGLTETGICFVEEMERLGMIIDVSHLSDAGFYDVLNYTKKPFVASHSNARTVCSCVRNLTDDMIRKLAERGGVIGLNFCGDFLKYPVEEDTDTQDEIVAMEKNEQKGYHTMPGSKATYSDIIRHARHIIQIGGMECIGLGSDFDGIPGYPGCPKVESMDELAETFIHAGFTSNEVDHIFYLNTLRLYQDALRETNIK
ncbi:MAG: dipeptidase [Lachnospiraceae bacterium]